MAVRHHHVGDAHRVLAAQHRQLGQAPTVGSDAGPWSTRDVLTGRWQLRRSKKESFDPVDTHTVPTMIGGIGGRAGAAIEE